MKEYHRTKNPFARRVFAEEPGVRDLLGMLWRQTLREMRAALASELDAMLLPETRALLVGDDREPAPQPRKSFQADA